MAQKQVKNDAPIISVRALILMHVILGVFIMFMAWVDWNMQPSF